MFENYILQLIPLFIGIFLSMVILLRMKIYASSGMFFSTPGEVRESQKTGVVEIGGLAIFPIVLISLCLTLGMSSWLEYYHFAELTLGITGYRVLQVISGCALLYIVGLKSDIHGTFGQTKFLILLASAALFPISGLWIRDFQGILGIHELPYWVGVPLTILISIFLTESIALLDDMDGLGVGIMTIMMSIFLGMSSSYGFTLGILVSSATLGVSLPYTLLKLFAASWRKTLVGSAGSYVLGYLLTYATLSLVDPAGIDMPEGTLMIVLGITMAPAMDLIRAMRSRVREGRALHTPDRNLMQHRFLRMGVPVALVPVCILLLISLFAALNTVWVLYGLNLSLLVFADIVLWVAIQAISHHVIQSRETRESQAKWVVSYGPQAWEADKPVDKIRQKRERFGSMGLPSKYILGDETDFIPDGMNAFERNLKRAIDCVAALILMVVFSPLFLLSYLLIKWDDRGPAIYAQERIGRFGRPFRIYKFRSMRTDAEQHGPALSHAGGDDDPRLTRVGKFLRLHHLDELPQLWNVFIGDMSFIGYRPERKFYIDQIMEHDPRYSMLYQIRPGVTSYATLYNGYTDTMEKMLRRLTYDLYYLEHRSFWFDMGVLWSTFINIIFGRKF